MSREIGYMALAHDFECALGDITRPVYTPGFDSGYEPMWIVMKERLEADDHLMRETLRCLVRASERGDKKADAVIEAIKKKHCEFHVEEHLIGY